MDKTSVTVDLAGEASGDDDVQMGLARMLPRAELIVVTTPAAARPSPSSW